MRKLQDPAKYQTAIRDALCKIIKVAQHRDPDLEDRLTRYLRLVSSGLAKADRGIQDMPTFPKYNKRSSGRHCVSGTYGEVVTFTLGNTLIAWWKLINDQGNRLKNQAIVQRFLDIANHGLGFYFVVGDDYSGYCLKSEKETFINPDAPEICPLTRLMLEIRQIEHDECPKEVTDGTVERERTTDITDVQSKVLPSGGTGGGSDSDEVAGHNPLIPVRGNGRQGEGLRDGSSGG
jgi:hypothetical protein